MTVKYKIFKESFLCKIYFFHNEKITVEAIEGPFKFLYNEWKFIDQPDNNCLVKFSIHFEMKSLLLSKILDYFFYKAFIKMMNSFKDQAYKLYLPFDKKLSYPAKKAP